MVYFEKSEIPVHAGFTAEVLFVVVELIGPDWPVAFEAVCSWFFCLQRHLVHGSCDVHFILLLLFLLFRLLLCLRVLLTQRLRILLLSVAIHVPLAVARLHFLESLLGKRGHFFLLAHLPVELLSDFL